jgi:hypothetical protein
MTEKNLARFYAIAQEIWSQLPPQARFRPVEDGKILARHRTFLEGLTEGLVQGFYDTLFAHPPTRAVFREGERPLREKTLRDWYLRTLAGPFNGQYFAWQALVGLVHLRRGVTNAMMTSMWNWLTEEVARKAREALPPEEARALAEGMGQEPASFRALAQREAERLLGELSPR